ncbi:MAG: DUF512 domain-containing protein [Acidobacteriota bacterium]
MSRKGIKILAVDPGSIAEKFGITSGDILLEVDGHEVDDELALRFYLTGETVDLLTRSPDGKEKKRTIELHGETDLGLEIEEFKTRWCNNACLFCFVDQLPPEARPSLRVKDDDYRLSFLHGNFITLTNLDRRDIERIIELRLSPLYISVHATEPDLRTRILGRKKRDYLLPKIEMLVKHRIMLHAQIVLMPGINDGDHLERTIHDLYRFYPGIQSSAVVPLGLSDYGLPRETLKPVTPAFCRKTIRQVTVMQDRFRAERGETFVYLADEFYIQGGQEFPRADLYDDFAQIEDGVGMVRAFLDAFEGEWKRHRKSYNLRGTLVTGKLFYPLLLQCIGRFNRKFGSRLRVLEAGNSFLGKRITVAGLLSGRDILKALENKSIGDFVIIPQEALSRPEGILLDDLSLQDLSCALDKPVYPGGRTAHEFFQLLRKLSDKRNRRT